MDTVYETYNIVFDLDDINLDETRKNALQDFLQWQYTRIAFDVDAIKAKWTNKRKEKYFYDKILAYTGFKVKSLKYKTFHGYENFFNEKREDP